LLLINLGDGPYVADVGFGGLTLTGPLKLEADIVQETPHETFRVRRAGDAFIMQADISGAWKSLYRFELQQQFLVDYEVTNWYLSNHPQSPFVTGLIAARPDSDHRYALRNNEFTVHHRRGGTERHLLTSAAELRTTLESTFRLTLPTRPELDVALERLVASTEPVLA
jgi:N-hydroxyarylamine O-acetyltransferase